MTRLTTLKISLLSALATLFLLVAMLASTGTASAHTASNQTTAFHHPHIDVIDTTPIGGGCEQTLLDGFGFAPGFVHLEAWQDGQSLFVQPADPFTDGSFTQLDVTICGGFGLGHHHHGLGWPHCFNWHTCYGLGYGYGLVYDPTELIAQGPNGVYSNSVSLQSGEPIYIRR